MFIVSFKHKYLFTDTKQDFETRKNVHDMDSPSDHYWDLSVLF